MGLDFIHLLYWSKTCAGMLWTFSRTATISKSAQKGVDVHKSSQKLGLNRSKISQTLASPTKAAISLTW